MKKIVYILLFSLLLVSCEDWLDVNTNPNSPTYVPGYLLLPSVQASTAVTVGGNMFNYGGFFAQYWGQSVEANQYNAIDKYDIKNVFFNDDYTELLAGSLYDCQLAIDDSKANMRYGDMLAATVLKAYTYQYLIDMIDKIPYSEAFQGNANPTPIWEDGSVVYQELIQEIDSALIYANSDPLASVTERDLLLEGEISKWKLFANAVKLKFFMRESYQTDRNRVELLELISNMKFLEEDVKFAVFTDEENRHNPWYETAKIGLGTDNHVAVKPIMSYLKVNEDPRLPLLFQLASGSNTFESNFPGWKDRPNVKNSNFSFPIIGKTQPVYLYTQSELYFFIAEAQLRFNNDDAAAQAAYEQGIVASFKLHGLSETAAQAMFATDGKYEWDSALTLEEKLEKIMMQKWVALCMVNHIEAWTEIRRTGYPQLSTETGPDILDDPEIYTAGQLIDPVANVIGSGQLIKRLPYPEKASIRNKNTPAQPGLTSTIWWDTK